MDNDADRQRVRRAQAGDAAAFAALLEAHYDLMYRFAFRWCGQQQAAEDITQQSCIKLAEAIGQFRFESAFTTWLYRLVINCARDWQRREKRHANVDASELIEPMESHRGEAHLQLEQLLRQIDTLGKGFSETALLVLGEGLTHAEAATVLQVKESTISWRLHSIRQQLAATGGEAMS